jgi:copper chaperone CopZ
MTRNLSLEIQGMSCDGCVASVKRVLSRLPGAAVKSVTVGAASVVLEDDSVTDADLVQAIDKAGYSARLA